MTVVSNTIGVNHATISLSPDLEQSMVEQFDHLVSKGEVFWGPYFSEPVQDQGFKACFQLAPQLDSKPMQSQEERKSGKSKNPFVNPDPNFIAAYVGEHHTLLENKYCVYRPSLILHTNKFVPQEHDLDASDLIAAWALIKHFKQPYMMIYNCGFDSGSSQGHKHMQLWPYPDRSQIGFDLFPNEAKSTNEITSNIPNVPHQHFVLRLPADADAAHIINSYARLLSKVKQCHKLFGSTAYNVAMTRNWLCLIPRRDCGISRGAGANAAGVLGLIWLSYTEEKPVWLNPGLCDYMKFLGVPRTTSNLPA